MKYSKIKNQLKQRFEQHKKEQEYNEIANATAAAIFNLRKNKSNLLSDDSAKIEFVNSILKNTK